MRNVTCFLAVALVIFIGATAARAESGVQQLAQASPAPSGQKLVGLDA